MSTIKDVAGLAGVSTSTVSHVLNKTRFVRDDTRKRVEQAMRKLDYRPSSIARSLKVKRTGTVGMLVTTSTNPFYAEVVQGVERRCYERGYTLFLCNTEGDAQRMKANLEALEEKRVDGLLLLCSETNEEVFRLFEARRTMPIVVTDWGPITGNMDRIHDNSRLGGYLATKHLIAMGHVRIGCISGPRDKLLAMERVEGFRQAMAEADLPIRSEWIIEGHFDCESGVQAMRHLHELDERPDALFVGNDMMAFGVINEARRLGLNIPDDLSLVGYDDIHMARYMSPALTTIHQPTSKLGALAVDTLLDRLDSKRTEAKVIRIEPSLVIRESVRAGLQP
ncbi:substrate-binding domain-containing protein [Pseudodesulfovibrio tunisiensis]|uniref:substrate-binding domain-containing protein n=1 Tax=Pseudodesulfovibrio tunisiensis TaxID=463192 RepID=UPI001FB341E3|nr:substrate-binding domain-containing protein [Pseudodesulfovibrio tunisiensis]